MNLFQSINCPVSVRAVGLWVAILAGWASTPCVDRALGQKSEDKATEKVIVAEGQVFDHNGAGVVEVQVSLRRKSAAPDAEPIAQATTDHYGDFRLEHAGPLSGGFEVVFHKEGYSDARHEVELIAGQPPPFVDLELPGGLSLTGSVMDKLEDKPVAAATVRLFTAGREWKTETDRTGKFRIEKLPPAPAQVVVKAEGFGREKTDVKSLAETTTLTVQLLPERIVRFVVVDQADSPVAGATIECYDESHDDFRSMVTDAKGQATARGVHFEAHTLHVRVTHAEFVSDAELDREVPLPADTPLSEHRMVLSAAGRVKGTVSNATTGEPMQGVRIVVGKDLSEEALRDWADFEGKYEIGGVAPGVAVVTTYLNGYAPELKVVQVQANEKTSADFSLHPSKTVGGVVVDEEGSPIGGAIVYCTSWRGQATLGIETMTDPAGRFEMGSIPDDPFEIAIHAGGYDPLSGQFVQPGKTDHRFELKKEKEEQAPKGPAVGQPFPQLEMVTLDGTPLKLADLRGKTVLIDFWATWCVPCVAEIPNLLAVNEALGKRKDFVIISVSLDGERDEKKLRKFIADKKMKWTHVFGKAGGAVEAASTCAVAGIPASFLVGPDGVLRAAGLRGPGMKDQVAAVLKGTQDGPQP